MNLPIAAVMSRHPVSIAPGAPLVAAHRAMREHHTDHLVVLERGRLVGVVSIDDLHLLESLGDVDPRRVPVEDALSGKTYTVAPGAPLAEVAAGMLARGADAAVVLDGDQVAGLFTPRDALSALASMLQPVAGPEEDHAS